MVGRREVLRVAAGGAAAAVGAPALARAQGKGKVRLAYLQLGSAATEIIHKADLLGKYGWSAEYSIVAGAPAPLLNQLAADARPEDLEEGGPIGSPRSLGDSRAHPPAHLLP